MKLDNTKPVYTEKEVYDLLWEARKIYTLHATLPFKYLKNYIWNWFIKNKKEI